LVTIEKIATKTNMISRFIVSDFPANNEQEVVRLVEKILYRELWLTLRSGWGRLNMQGKTPAAAS